MCVCVCVCVCVVKEVQERGRDIKCVAERRKPISEQHGAIQCTAWFRSHGGLDEL